MERVAKERKSFQFPFYVTKRIGLAPWKYWLIRGGGVVLAFLLAGIVCAIIKPGTFGLFYSELIRGCFDFSDFSTIIDFLVLFSVLLMIALALTPAFKMKFWNIGAEGQILIGCLISGGIAKFAPSDMPNAIVLMLCLIGAVAGSIVWSVVPAIFKAFFNTNETLFTLMLNYIATVLAAMCIDLWDPSNHKQFGTLENGIFPETFDTTGLIAIIVAIGLFVFMYFYIKKSIHGYEVSVVGESVNTARYVGINVKKVIIRTMIFTGAIMGIIGFIIVCGIDHSFTDDAVGGQGFTGVLIAWLGHFEPFEMALFAFLSAFMQKGTSIAASNRDINVNSDQFSGICIGIFFFIIIACEFFSSYQIKIHRNKQLIEEAIPEAAPQEIEEAKEEASENDGKEDK